MTRTPHPLRHLLVLTGVVILILGVSGLWIAHSRGSFEPRTTFKLQTTSAEGLFRGMQVTYKGFRLGQLRALALQPTGDVLAVVEVEARHAGFFTEGASLKLSKERIVTSELVLLPGTAGRAPLAEQSGIPLLRDDLAADLGKRVEPLLKNLGVLLQQLSDPTLGVQATLTQSRRTMEQTTAAMQQTTRMLALMNDPQQGLPAMLIQTRDTMGALMPLARQGQTTLGEIERSLVDSRTAVQQSQQLLRESQRLIGQLSDTERGLPATLSRANTLLDQLNDPGRGVGVTLGRTGQLLESLDTTVRDVQAAPIYRFLVPRRVPSTDKVPAPSGASPDLVR